MRGGAEDAEAHGVRGAMAGIDGAMLEKARRAHLASLLRHSGAALEGDGVHRRLLKRRHQAVMRIVIALLLMVCHIRHLFSCYGTCHNKYK